MRCSGSHVASWHVGEEETQSLGHRRVRENGVAEPRVWQAGQHRRLHDSHDLASLRADHGEAENAVVIRADENLHEALLLADRLRSQDCACRQLANTRRYTLALRLSFAQPHVGERRVRKNAIGHQPIARAALSSR